MPRALPSSLASEFLFAGEARTAGQYLRLDISVYVIDALGMNKSHCTTLKELETKGMETSFIFWDGPRAERKEKITVEVPASFLALAHQLKQQPERIGQIACESMLHEFHRIRCGKREVIITTPAPQEGARMVALGKPTALLTVRD
jgi:hypothetical protein